MEKRRFDPILIQGRPESIFFSALFILLKKIMFFWLKLVAMWENVGNMFHICAINLRPRRGND